MEFYVSKERVVAKGVATGSHSKVRVHVYCYEEKTSCNSGNQTARTVQSSGKDFTFTKLKIYGNVNVIAWLACKLFDIRIKERCASDFVSRQEKKRLEKMLTRTRLTPEVMLSRA
jgi:hypothetical protein